VIHAIQRHVAARKENGEGGFTLIELMVVVMIIAILLGIAIPAFLGARSRAQDTASKSNLRNALGAAQTRFSDQQVFEATTAIVAGLTTDEPSLKFVTGSTASTDSKTISVDTVASTGGATDPLDEIYLASYSKSGTCYWIRHTNAPSATTPVTVFGGSYIASAKVASSGCTAVAGETGQTYSAL
jgi:type IV pilus assembly protein PilA